MKKLDIKDKIKINRRMMVCINKIIKKLLVNNSIDDSNK